MLFNFRKDGIIMVNLTSQEQRIYEFIAETIRREGYPPTVRDIQKALEIKSTSTVHAYLEKLEEKGVIVRSSGKSRSVRVNGSESSEQKKVARIPVVGAVAAGMPILAQENIEYYIDFPLVKRSYNPSELFALTVKGESMIEAGIMNGDTVVIQKGCGAENGEIVVALVEEDDGYSATVKTFYKENGHFRLQPENSTMQPIIVDSVSILGKVIAVLRFY